MINPIDKEEKIIFIIYCQYKQWTMLRENLVKKDKYIYIVR